MMDSLSTTFRRRIFLPALFGVRRLPVHAAIAAIAAEDRRTRNEIEARQFERLHRIVAIAYEKTAVYRGLYETHGVRPDRLRSLEDLPSFPMVDRPTLQRHTLHDRITRGGDVAARRLTTGTTGQPLEIVLNRGAYAAQLGARLRHYQDLGIRMGDREGRFWGRPGRGWKASMREVILGRHTVTLGGRNEEELLKEARDLVKYSPRYFYGYASMLIRAAQVWEEYDLPRLPLAAIVSTAETLHEFQRHRVEETFQCPVVVEYGCSEMDIVAFGCVAGALHVVTHNVLVESCVSESGVQELLLTDLHNEIMPLIRYRIGDGGTICWDRCACGRTTPQIQGLSGRTNAQFVILPGARRMHCIVFTHLLDALVEEGIPILQSRVVQDDLLSFTVHLEIRGPIDEIALGRRIGDDIRSRVHDQASTRLVVGPIPVEERAKFTDFVALRP